MSSYKIVYTGQARKDGKKLAASGLKPKAQELFIIIRSNPFEKYPPFEKLKGDMVGAYSRRINYTRSHNVRSVSQTENRKGHSHVDALRMKE